MFQLNKPLEVHQSTIAQATIDSWLIKQAPNCAAQITEGPVTKPAPLAMSAQ